MTDQKLIDKAYEATIQQLCTQLYTTLLVSQEASGREQAERRFQTGVRKAREARDRAKQLLP